MPTYLYFCDYNKEEFETEHSIKIELEECIICKENNLPAHKPKRLIAGSTLGRVNLTGHELTTKTKEDVSKMRQRLKTDTNFHANIVGESAFDKLVK